MVGTLANWKTRAPSHDLWSPWRLCSSEVTQIFQMEEAIKMGFYVKYSHSTAGYKGPKGLPWWLSGKEFTCNAGDMGSVPRWGRSSEEGNGYPLQYSCLEYHMDRGAWWATVHGVPKSQTQLSS